MAAKATQDTRTLLVETTSDLFKLTIPADYKVTFAAINPQAASFRGDQGTHALRIYEADSKQRAVFTNVLSFRDLSLPLQRIVETEEGSTEWQDDGKGNRSASRKVKRNVVSVNEEL